MADLDLVSCDSEPIHLPGSIQPHGLLFVADTTSLLVCQGAGAIEARLGLDGWVGAPLARLIGDDLARKIRDNARGSGSDGYMGQVQALDGTFLDVVAHRTGDHVLVELEQGAPNRVPAIEMLGVLEAAGDSFSRAASVQDLCDRAASEFRRVTGFDRVMIYRFLEDDTGKVLAEDKHQGMSSFLNQHFPSSDIPLQARALYVRNLVRVIVDVDYEPQPLQPPLPGAPLDMSDSSLRSVSPIHVQYLKNMGVRASASISIVEDGRLWGLVACHHMTSRSLPFDVRAACRTLAGGLAMQVKARREAEVFRERVRVRGLEDEVLQKLDRETDLGAALILRMDDLRRILKADGFAIVGPKGLHATGTHPHQASFETLASWVAIRAANELWRTDSLAGVFPEAVSYQHLASGMLAVVVPADEPLVLLWTRVEQLQVINWAGNPHKPQDGDPGILNPRSSFAAWSDTVRGRATDWSMVETESAARLKTALAALMAKRRLGELNRQLLESLVEKEAALEQKQVMLLEMNHRIQNSIQLVSSFLSLQARDVDDPLFAEAINEARRRLGAVSLVHRRLYRAGQIHQIEMSRYVEELWEDLMNSMGNDWQRQSILSLSPVLVSTDSAVTIGLILTELIINAQKHAYAGGAGPLEVTLEALPRQVRLVVADRGVGATGAGSGFGSKMMNLMVAQLSGTLEYQDNLPGTRSVLTIPVAA